MSWDAWLGTAIVVVCGMAWVINTYYHGQRSRERWRQRRRRR